MMTGKRLNDAELASPPGSDRQLAHLQRCRKRAIPVTQAAVAITKIPTVSPQPSSGKAAGRARRLRCRAPGGGPGPREGDRPTGRPGRQRGHRAGARHHRVPGSCGARPLAGGLAGGRQAGAVRGAGRGEAGRPPSLRRSLSGSRPMRPNDAAKARRCSQGEGQLGAAGAGWRARLRGEDDPARRLRQQECIAATVSYLDLKVTAVLDDGDYPRGERRSATPG